MKKISCLNLAEWMNGIYQTDGTYQVFLDRMKEQMCEHRFERVYFGSSFCSVYFLHSTAEMIKSLCLCCEKEQMKLTLVIPVFSQSRLKEGKKKIDELLEAGGSYIDEVTVNDLGMMVYMNEKYKKRITIGRLLMKDYRDRRYEEYFRQTLIPKLFNSEFLSIADSYHVQGVEMDLTHERIDLAGIPNKYTIGIHYPYCYQTVGKICEAASSMKEVSQKFRANADCGMECEHQLGKFLVMMSGEYYKRGRTAYFDNRKCEILNRQEVRMIYSPLWKEAFRA